MPAETDWLGVGLEYVLVFATVADALPAWGLTIDREADENGQNLRIAAVLEGLPNSRAIASARKAVKINIKAKFLDLDPVLEDWFCAVFSWFWEDIYV